MKKQHKYVKKKNKTNEKNCSKMNIYTFASIFHSARLLSYNFFFVLLLFILLLLAGTQTAQIIAYLFGYWRVKNGNEIYSKAHFTNKKYEKKRDDITECNCCIVQLLHILSKLNWNQNSENVCKQKRNKKCICIDVCSVYIIIIFICRFGQCYWSDYHQKQIHSPITSWARTSEI